MLRSRNVVCDFLLVLKLLNNFLVWLSSRTLPMRKISLTLLQTYLRRQIISTDFQNNSTSSSSRVCCFDGGILRATHNNSAKNKRINTQTHTHTLEHAHPFELYIFWMDHKSESVCWILNWFWMRTPPKKINTKLGNVYNGKEMCSRPVLYSGWFCCCYRCRCRCCVVWCC